MLLFQRTSIAEARTVIKHGFADDRWLVRDLRDGSEQSVVGVQLCDRPDYGESVSDESEDALMEVDLNVSEESLAPFEVEGALDAGRLWIVPATLLNPRARVRIRGVDPRTSWWHEAPEGSDDQSG